MITEQDRRFANRALATALVLVAIDFMTKVWVFKHYIPPTNILFFELVKVYTVRMSLGIDSLASYFPVLTRLLWLMFLGFLFVRVRRIQTTDTLIVGATLSFIGLAANHVDTMVFPLLDKNVPQLPAYVQLNYLNFDIYYFSITFNVADIVTRFGLIVLFVGAIASFQSFRGLFRRQQP